MTAPVVHRETADEEAVLGAVMLAGAKVLEPLLAETGLRAGHFSRPSYAAVFEAMTALFDRGDGIDHLTVTAELRRTGHLEAAGGETTVEGLAAAPPVTGHATTYAAAVIESARWRARHLAALDQLDAVQDRDEDRYLAAATPEEPERSQTLVPQALAHRFEEWLDTTGDVVPLPWPRLNDGLYGGGRRGDTTIVAGHSSHGKSIASVQWLEHVGIQGGHVGLYTNEMAVEDVTARLLAGITSIGFERILSKRLTADERKRLRFSYQHLSIKIVEAYGWPWQDIARHMRRQRWDLCCLDLFNRLPGRDRTSDVDAAISGLCNAAAQSGAHLIVVSQLNQERSKGGVRPLPTGRDLRESGAMYNDPANVIFVHRDQEEVDEVVKRLNEGRIIIDKARNGRPGTWEKVWLNPLRMRFEGEEEWRGRSTRSAA